MSRRTWLIILVFLLGVGCASAVGKTIYVDDDGPADFNNIQAAIDDSNDGDTIIVQPGLYPECVKFGGKNITLTSTNPGNFDVVASTIIEYGVGFAGTEEPNCALTGFKINGWISGGMNHTHATISHCLLSGNNVPLGTVIRLCDGTISNCVVVDNRTIGDFIGPAVTECHGLIKNCTIAHNVGSGVFIGDGGITYIENCVIYHNNSGQVGVGNGGTVNILHSNVEGGLSGIYGNGNVNWGPGNIDTDPCFVRIGDWYGELNGDYHLLPDSPCIDAGDPNYIAEPNETDLDGKPRVMGGRIDMGAYEYRPSVPAEVGIVPRSINLASKGKWITAFIWLPEDCDVVEIDPNSVVLEDEIGAESVQVDEEKQVAIVRFSRSEVQGILDVGDVELTISGQLTDGTVFEGADVIKVIRKGGKK